MDGPFFDMHCHLAFASNAVQAAQALHQAGAGTFACCVSPGEFAQASLLLAPWPSVRVGVGLHPWWVSGESLRVEDAGKAAELARMYPFVGEVGLDFGAAHASSAQAQRQAFAQMMGACADGAGGQVRGKAVSLHAVRSADAVLDVLEQTGAIENCTCIFHWYSDTPEALQRAIRAGCLFSFGVRSLATRRGREYARQVPAAQLLLETDEPAQGSPYDVDAAQVQLAQACRLLEDIKGAPLAAGIRQTSAEVLGLGVAG